MTAIKSYTDLEQSKKLSEILPLDSADMWYSIVDNEAFICLERHNEYEQIPCWSLTALFKLLPKSAQLEKGNVTELYRVTLPVELEASDWYTNPIDACYELILKI
jgi:hypothetical protein